MWFIFVRGHCPWGVEALFLATLSEYHHQFSYAICGIYGPIYIAGPWPCCQWTESFSPRQLTHTAHTRASPKLTNQTLFFQQFYLMKTHDSRYMRYISLGSIECQTKWRYWIHLNMHWGYITSPSFIAYSSIAIESTRTIRRRMHPQRRTDNASTLLISIFVFGVLSSFWTHSWCCTARPKPVAVALRESPNFSQFWLR